jgi:uncharacterized protein (TIGR02246 family)
MPVDGKQFAAIEEAVKRVAWEHLRAKDAAQALSHYEPDAIVASNASVYPSFERFAEDAREFYRTVQRIDLAVWDGMHVQVLGEDAAVLTATFRWSSTDTSGGHLDLQGVWTAVFVQRDGRWRMCSRHESFAAQADRK